VLTIGGTGNTTVGTRITGAGGLTKTGTGILSIDGNRISPYANSFSGQLTVENGTLAISTINNASSDGALGNSALAVILGASGQTGTLQWIQSNSFTTNKRFRMAENGTGAFDILTPPTRTLTSGAPSASTADGLILTGLLDSAGSMNGAMTKKGFGNLTLRSSVSNTFTGGLNVIGGGTLALDFVSMGTPTDVIAAANALTLNGGFMTIKAKTGVVTTAQTFNGVTANAGGGSLLVDPLSAGGTTDVTLGALSFGGTGSSLVLGRANTNTGTLNITTTTDYDAQSIYGARTVFASGAVGAGYDWATRDSSVGGGPFTLAAFGTGGNFGTYTPMTSGGANDLANVETGTLLLVGSNTHNSLKITTGAALDLDVNQLTLASGGLLSTGTTASTISGTGALGLTAGAGTGHELIVHQYNTAANGLTISAVIGDNGGNAVKVTKAGTGNLILSGANTFTGQLTVQGGTLSVPTINNVSSNGTLGNSASAVIIGNAGVLKYTGSTASSDKPFIMAAGGSGRIEVSDGIDNNNQTLTLSGVISGSGGLTAYGVGGTANSTFAKVDRLKLTGLNTYTGVTTIDGGVLEVDNLQNAGVASSIGAYALPGTSGIVLYDGSMLRYTGPSMATSIDRGITIHLNHSNSVAATIDLPINGDMRIGSLTNTVQVGTANGANTNLAPLHGTQTRITGNGAASRLYIDEVIVPTVATRLGTGVNIVPISANVTIGAITGNGNINLGGTSAFGDNIVTGPIHLGEGYTGYNITQRDHAQIAGNGTFTIMSDNTFNGRWATGGGTFKFKSPGTVISGQNVSYAFGKSSIDWIATDSENTYKTFWANCAIHLLNDVSTSYETGFAPGRRTPVLIAGSALTIVVDRQGVSATNQTHNLGALWMRENVTLTVTGNNGFGLTFDDVRLEDTRTQVITTNTNLTLAKLRKIGGGTNNLTIRGTGTTTVTGVVERNSGSGTLNITKSEAGTLILNGQNTAPGTIAVQGGRLVAAHAEALGPIAQATTVSSGATLDVRAALVAEPISVTGTGVGGLGALITADTFTGTVTGPLTLTGNTRIGGAGSTGTLNIDGILAAGANTLTTLGTGVTNFGVPSTLTSLTNLLVTDGTTNVNSALGTAGNTTVDVSDIAGGPATKLRFGSVSQTLTSLTIGAGATVVFTSGLASGSLTGDDGGGKAAGFGSPASSFGGGATVPEPGTLGLLLVGALGTLNRRRRA
jgi:fibronectin-binding autotransporter adhesin